MAEAQARERAHTMYNDAYDAKGTFFDDVETFFDDGRCYARGNPKRSADEEKASRTLTIGTDCSGMEAPIQAVRNLGIRYSHEFSCDNDPDVVASMKGNFTPKRFYNDVTTRINAGTPHVDLYVAGFPCQPFSTAGKQQGFDDTKGRGNIFYDILDYITTRRPKVFILENVKGLTTLQGGKCLRTILKALHNVKQRFNETSEAYEIHHQVLNTKDHGVPQNRPRWYCVGIRKDTFGSDKSSFEFPRADIECPKIDLFLDAEPGATQRSAKERLPTDLSNTARTSIEKASRTILEGNGDPINETYVVDCDASTAKSRHVKDYSPCITRSRNRGHWITSRNRRMTISEMFRLQGMDPSKFTASIPESTLGQQIGNAMSVNVVERIIVQVLKATNLMPGATLSDRWKEGKAFEDLSASKGKPPKRITAYLDSKPDSIRVLKRKHAMHGRATRQLIVDSGASYHLVDARDLTRTERNAIRRLRDPIPLSTANGIVWAKYETDIYVIELDITVKAIILANTVPVLSLGRIVDDEGFDYIWRSQRVPFLEKGTIKVLCYPTNNVPFITNSLQLNGSQAPQPPTPPWDERYSPATPPSQVNHSQPDQAGGNLEPTPPFQSDDSTPTVAGGNPEPVAGGNPKLVEEGSPTPEAGGDPTKEKDLQCGKKRKVKVEQKDGPSASETKRLVRARDKRKAQRRNVSDCQQCTHNVFTHFPRDPNCDVCRANKPHKAYCKSKVERSPDALPEPKVFGDAVTADHKVLNDDDESRTQDQNACIVQDRATFWLQAYAALTKASEEVKKAFQRFLGPQGIQRFQQMGHIYTDNSKEFIKAFEDLGFSHDTSTPHRPETNGIAERAVRRVKEGTSCALSQSGFHDDWWVLAMECYCFYATLWTFWLPITRHTTTDLGQISEAQPFHSAQRSNTNPTPRKTKLDCTKCPKRLCQVSSWGMSSKRGEVGVAIFWWSTGRSWRRQTT